MEMTEHSKLTFKIIFEIFYLFCLKWPAGSLPYETKVVIAGNHELTFDKDLMTEMVKQNHSRFPKLRLEDCENVQSLLTDCIYLQDSEITVKGFRIYGTPW